MSDDTLKYVPEIAKRNYSIVLSLFIFTLILSLISGASEEVTLLRLAVIPLGFFAFKGLTSIYRQPIIEHKVTLRGVEYTTLTAVIASLVFVIYFWDPEQTYMDILKQFGMFFFAISVGCYVVMFMEIIRASRNRSR